MSSALVPITWAAVDETSINVDSSIDSLSIRFITTKQVIILVKLAHSLFSLSAFPNKSVFDFWSKIDHDCAEQWGAGLSIRIFASLISFAEISPSNISNFLSFLSELYASSNKSDSFPLSFGLVPFFVPVFRFFSSVVCMVSSVSLLRWHEFIISSGSCSLLLFFNFGGGKYTRFLPFLFGIVKYFQFW